MQISPLAMLNHTTQLLMRRRRHGNNYLIHIVLGRNVLNLRRCPQHRHTMNPKSQLLRIIINIAHHVILRHSHTANLTQQTFTGIACSHDQNPCQAPARNGLSFFMIKTNRQPNATDHHNRRGPIQQHDRLRDIQK